MKEILIKAFKEAIRVGLAAFLAALGIQSTGCIASGNNSAAAFSVSGK